MFPIYKNARYFLPLVILILGACYKAPKVDMPKFDDIMAGLKTCAKDARDQKIETASPVVKEDGAVTYQDTEVVSCDGSSTMLKNNLRKDILKAIALPIDNGVAEKLRVADVRFFKIQNQATCVNSVFDLKKISKDRSAVKAFLTADDLRLEIGLLNVRDGANALKIQFFGACTRYQRSSDDSPSAKDVRAENEGYECVEAPVLAEQDLVLDLKLTVTTLPGVHESKATCDK